MARSGSLRCVMISGAMPRLACQVACRSGCGVCGFSTVTGHLVIHRPGIARSSRAAGISYGSDTQSYQLFLANTQSIRQDTQPAEARRAACRFDLSRDAGGAVCLGMLWCWVLARGASSGRRSATGWSRWSPIRGASRCLRAVRRRGVRGQPRICTAAMTRPGSSSRGTTGDFFWMASASGRGREVLCSCREALCTASPTPGLRTRMLVIGSGPAQAMVEEVGCRCLKLAASVRTRSWRCTGVMIPLLPETEPGP